ncbi:MAG TPA: thermonuclease family protein [Nitrospiraceae bacterium]|jgi:endonuclease YncB( thermonuclease family)|nr:thermonuclease family protein [Nitrospiraceae bacterium]
MSELVFVKEVTVQTYGHDKYKCTLANVLLPDGTNVNHELAKNWWWYRKYAPGHSVLEGLETEVREVKKCLWADPHPMPPWEWRKRK